MNAEIIVDASIGWCNFEEMIPIPFTYYQHMSGMVYIADRRGNLINLNGGMYSGCGFRRTVNCHERVARMEFRHVRLSKAEFKVAR